MTQATLTRKQAELVELISEHRVVRATLPFGLDCMECVAPLDIPEIDVREGETFWLATSSYEDYCYPLTTTSNYDLLCRCEGFEKRRSCKHCKGVSIQQVKKYKTLKAAAIAEPVEKDPAHVTDSFRSGQQGKRAEYAFTSREQRAMTTLNKSTITWVNGVPM